MTAEKNMQTFLVARAVNSYSPVFQNWKQLQEGVLSVNEKKKKRSGRKKMKMLCIS